MPDGPSRRPAGCSPVRPARRWRPASSSGWRPPRRPSPCWPSSAYRSGGRRGPGRRRLRGRRGRACPIRATSAPSCARPRRPAPTPSCSRRTPSTSTNPKVVRASAGALFLLPVVDHVELGELRAAGLRVLGTSAAAGTTYTDADLTGRLALAVGNEAHGLPADAPGRRLAHHPPRRPGREPQRGDGRRRRLLRGRPRSDGCRPPIAAERIVRLVSAPAGTTTR